MGADLLHILVEQSVPGYPNVAQRNYYFHIPLLMAGGSLLLFLGSWLHKTTRPFGWFAGLLLFCLPLYLMFYTGGM